MKQVGRREDVTQGKGHSVRLQRIAVDLTPLLPGGENGGVKLMTLSLIAHLSRIAPDIEFLLLTTEDNHTELAGLDSANVYRVCVTGHGGPVTSWETIRKGGQRRLREWLTARLSGPMLLRLKELYRTSVLQTRRKALLKNLRVDLVFCPLTAPLFFDPTAPLVSVICDLQYLTYPQFFSSEERLRRDRRFREVCRVASRLVCISDYVRGSVLAHAEVEPAQVKTIHIRLPYRLGPVSPEQAAVVLKRFGLKSERFLLYPANFWLHKNHQMLLTAFEMFVARNPESDLQLVCTGAFEDARQSLRMLAMRMGLDGRAIFPGFLPDDEFAALLQSCRAMLFPSLYEGFGMPVLEAMAFGRPVLCSNVTSLPEIAGEAALFFDPQDPAAMVDAICQIESDAALVSHLRERGYQRAQNFGDTTEMARQYLQVFREATGVRPCVGSRQGASPDE